MRLSTALAGILLLCFIIVYTGCTNGAGTVFKTKEDSLAFAKTYFEKYPGENYVMVKYQSADTPAFKNFRPITWETVLDYQDRYDKNPIIYSPDKVALQGYFIDSAGYSLLQKNKNIKGIYLRFGKKTDDVFTIMILGTDAKGALIKTNYLSKNLTDSTGATDFDNTPSCPDYCPTLPK